MNILAVNASPKPKEKSVTQRLISLFEKKRLGHTVSTISVGPHFTNLNREPELKPEWLDAVRAADVVIWTFPVYYLWLPAQLVRFLEAVRRSPEWTEALAGKPATSVTTSIQFFDHTAHAVIRESAEDLGMRYFEGYSAEMQTLMRRKGQEKTLAFFDAFLAAVQRGTLPPRTTAPLEPFTGSVAASASVSPDRTSGRRVTLLTDARPDDRSLLAMVDTFAVSSPDHVEIINLHDIGLQGACLGCCRCGWDNTCAYRDGLKDFIRNKMISADGLVYAFRTEGRAFSGTVKAFRDRGFVFNHVPFLRGKKALWLVDGPLSRLAALQEIIRSTAELGGMVLCGTVSSELEPETLTAALSGMSLELHHAILEDRAPSHTFREVAGRKLFRDFVWLNPIFRNDNRHYRKAGYYDFPQKKRGTRMVRSLIRTLLHLPGFRKKVYTEMTEMMTGPLDRAIKKA